jgi:hypothetical protein
MLSKSLIDEIDQLLKEGRLSQRRIADRLRVSRGVVTAIAGGRRGLHGREVGDNVAMSLAPVGSPERCPRCGYRVYMPCLVCIVREHRARQMLCAAFLQELHRPLPAQTGEREIHRRTRRRRTAGRSTPGVSATRRNAGRRAARKSA